MMSFSEFTLQVLAPKKGKMDGDRLYSLERSLSVRISWFVFRFCPIIRPNHVTYLSFVFLFTAGALGTYTLHGGPLSLWSTLAAFLVLYSVSIADKVDGELARARNELTQRGMYLDRAVHLAYPVVFYFAVASHFAGIQMNYAVFVLTLLAGVLTQMLVSQREWRLLIGDNIKKGKLAITDLRTEPLPKKDRGNVVMRALDYLTFMIYAWTLFFYIILILLSVWLPLFAYVGYISHLTLVLCVNGYRVFIGYPRDRLFSTEEVERLNNQ